MMSAVNKDRVLVSIIVPVYNTAKYLRKCIDSLINQTYTNLEILLIDDGSTDDSGTICDLYSTQDKRIKVFHKKNGGVSSARNLGLKGANGYYVTFVDADDWLEPECVNSLLDMNTADYDILAFSCTKDFEKSTTKVFFFDSDRSFNLNDEKDRRVVYSMKLCGSSCMKLYKRELLLFEYNSSISNGEDVLFNIENIGNFKRILYHRIPAYHMTCHINSASRNTDFTVFKKYEHSFSVIKEKVSNQYTLSLYFSYVAACLLQIILFNVYPAGGNYFCGTKRLKEIRRNDYIAEMLSNTELLVLDSTRKICVICYKYYLYFFVYLIAHIKHRIDK